MSDAVTRPAPPERRRRLRRLGTWTLRVVLCVLVLAEALYLARRPLLERWLCAQIADALGPALGGSAELKGLGGDWITRLRIEGLSLRTDGLLREVRDASVDVQIDPWALALGDLGGVRRARVRVAACTLDLTAEGPPATEPPAPAGAAFDLGALTALLPAGARIEVGALALIGIDARIEGTVGVHLAPARGPGPRRALVAGPGVLADAALDRDGRIHAGFSLRDLSRIPRLFTPLHTLVGGDVSGQATLTLAPSFACDATVNVRNLRAAEQAVETLRATARVDDEGLRGLSASLVAPGLRIEVDDAGFTYTDFARTLRGRTLVDLRDLTAYSSFVPAELRAQMPITGWLAARAADGLLTLDEGRVRTAGARVDVSAGAIALDGVTLLPEASPVRFALRLLDSATLQLAADLPVRPTSGEVWGTLSQRTGVFVVDASVRTDLVDPQGRAGSAHGQIRVEAGTGLRLVPNLRVQGPLLRDLGSQATLDTAIVVAGDTLGIERLTVGLDAAPAIVTAAGRVRLGGTPAEIVAESDVRIDFAALPLAPGLALAGVAAARGQLTGHVHCAAGAVSTELDATLEGLAIAPALAWRAKVQARADDTGVALTEASVATDAGSVRVHGRLAGQTLRQALTDGLSGTARPDLTVDAQVSDLAHLPLAALLGLSAAGDVRAHAQVTGTLGAPAVTGDLRLAGVALADPAGRELARVVAGRIVVVAQRARIAQLDAVVAGHALSVTGEVARVDDGLTLSQLTVRDEHGGALGIDGRVPRLLSAPWQDAIATAEVDLTLSRYALLPWLTLAGIPAEAASAEGTLQITPGLSLALDLRAQGTALVVGGRTFAPTCEIIARADGGGTRLQTLTLDIDGTHVDGSGSLAVTPSQALADPDAAQNAALALHLAVPTASLALLPSAMLGLAELQGALDLAADVKGSIAAPEVTANVSLRNGQVVTLGGQRIDDLVVQLACTPTSVEVTNIACTRGKGPLSITGSFKAPGPLWERWADGTLDFAVKGDNVLLHRRAGVKVRADVDVTAHGPLSDFAIAGDIGLRDGRLVTRMPLLDLRSSGGRAATEGIPLPSIDLGEGRSARLDLRVKTLDPFVVKNNVLDGALHVQLAVSGDLSQPILSGSVSGPDSTLILPGVRLRTSTLLVDFAAANPRFPTVTATARGRRHGFDIQAVVRGRYDRPEIVLSSDPPLPADELIVLVTTGARPQALGGAQGVGTVLGAYLAQELADWIFGSESTEAKESFLERFSVETGTEISRGGTESVIVEFRVLDRMYLQGERDVYEDLNMGVVYRLRFK